MKSSQYPGIFITELDRKKNIVLRILIMLLRASLVAAIAYPWWSVLSSIAPIEKSVFKITLYSIKISSIAVFFVGTLSAFIAMLLVRHAKTKVRNLFMLIAQLSWAVPGVVLGSSMLMLCTRLYPQMMFSNELIIATWVLGLLPWMVGKWIEAWEKTSSVEVDAARVLGLPPTRGFFYFLFYQRFNEVFQAIILCFSVMWTSYSIVVLLGGGPPHETLEVSLIHEIQSGSLEGNLAMQLGLMQALVLAGIQALSFALQKKQIQVVDISGKPSLEGKRSHSWIVVTSALFLIFPLGAWLGSIAEGGKAWMHLGIVLFPFVSSILIAFAVLLGILFCFFAQSIKPAHKIESAVLLSGAMASPSLISWMWWDRYFPDQPMPLLELILLIGVQVALFLPWALRQLMPAWENMDYAAIESSRIFGAGPFRSFLEVEWPRLRAPALACVGGIFVLSMSEVGATLLFARGDFKTLALWTQEQAMRFKLEQAAVGGSILGFVIIFISMIGKKHERSAS